MPGVACKSDRVMNRLYSDLASWWPLLSAAEDYAEEAAHHWRLMSKYAQRPIEHILELGCGGGNNAVHLKKHSRMTLSDLAPQMLDISRSANPECEHVQGDMRTLRLSHIFDVVFVHDAIMYMCTEIDLRQVMTTASQHCAPDGIVLFVPDCIRETWTPETTCGGHDGIGRSLRYLNWTHDPDLTDTQFASDMIYALKEADQPPRVEIDRHIFGLFPEATWMELLTAAGFTPHVEHCAYEGGQFARSFVGVQPSRV